MLIQINKYINKGEIKTLPYDRMPTNQYGMNNEIRKSPFAIIIVINDSGKNHQCTS